MSTKLRQFLRSIRSGSGELLKDMARRLDLSPAMLSSVENGKRNVPKGFVEKVATAYSLSIDQIEDLRESIAQTKEEVSLSLKGLSDKDQELALSFARRFSELDDESKRNLQDILNKWGNR